ncbi:MAG: hypothetical protein JSV19_04490 [Phycisphaerales bacterium]|nr:MAG: hypothetical protein JSV19_04490 [Phycisphaerales bacterium]
MAKFTCPGCGTHYRLPEGAAGKRVRCKKCGKITQILDDDDGPIRLAGEPDDFFAEAAAAASRGGPAATADSPGMGYPSADSASHAVAEADALVAAGRISDTRPAGRTFWSDVGWSFLFITQPGNVVTFVIIWLLYIAGPIVRFSGCIGIAASLILAGWICSFLLKCVVEAASGEDDLPKLTLTEGFMDDILVPLFKVLVTLVVLFVPPLAYLVFISILASDRSSFIATGLGDPITLLSTEGMIALPYALLMAAAIYLAPIALLVVALGGVLDLFRIDLIVRTITQTFLPYLATFAFLAGAIMLFKGARWVISAAAGGTTFGANAVVLGLLGSALTAYFDISVARIIGLYYRHYKHRFAWQWE